MHEGLHGGAQLSLGLEPIGALYLSQHYKPGVARHPAPHRLSFLFFQVCSFASFKVTFALRQQHHVLYCLCYDAHFTTLIPRIHVSSAQLDCGTSEYYGSSKNKLYI